MSHADCEPDEIEWKEDLSKSWSRRAYDMIQDGELTARLRRHGQRYTAVIDGACPRCGHELAFSLPLTGLVPSGNKRWPGTSTREDPDDIREPVQVNVDVQCGCEQTHCGAPDGVTGCGVAFRVEFAS